jgi:hypothetical protein
MTVEDAPESFDPTIPDTIEQRSNGEASGDGQEPLPVRFPSPESNSGYAMNGGNASAPNRESNRDQDTTPVDPVQSPFTRSSAPFPKHPGNAKNSSEILGFSQTICPACTHIFSQHLANLGAILGATWVR